MKKIIKYIFSDKKFCIIAAILTIINSLLVVKLNTNLVDNHHHGILKITIPVLLSMQIIAFYLMKHMLSKNKKIENIFLLFAIIFGSFYLITIPMSCVPDENNHFLRSYEISTGNLISKRVKNKVGNYLPTNIEKILVADNHSVTYNQLLKKASIKYNSKTKFYTFANTSLYAFPCYIPQALGILVGRIINLPILLTAYLGRIFNFIVWLILIYLSIKYIPVGKKTLFLISLLPMTMQEAISLAPDAMTNAIAIALVAYVLYFVYSKNKISKKNMIVGSLLCILISLLKIVYLPLCLLVLLIPANKFKSAKDKYLKIGILALVVIIINLIWLKISSGFLIEFQPGVNSAMQVKYILTNPFHYIVSVFSTYEYNFIIYTLTMLGSNLEWLNVYISQPYLLIFFAFMLYVALNEKDKLMDKKVKYMFVFIITCVIMLISTSLYVQWTAVGSREIAGIQGRYFLPILLPCLLLLKNTNMKSDIKHPEYIYYYLFSIDIFAIILFIYNHVY